MTFPQTVLPLMVELNLGGTWTDVTSYVQRRGTEGVTITRGRSDEAASTEPSAMRLSMNNRDGRFSPRNPTGPLYGRIGRNTPIRCSIIGSSYLQINQATGTAIGTPNVSTPDNAALDITGDIDIRVDVDFDSWVSGGRMALVSKWTSSGNQRAYSFDVESDGRLSMFWSTDGTAINAIGTVMPVPIATGRLTVRVTLDVNNGSGGYTISFYYGTGGVNGSFTLMGTAATTSGVTSIFSSSATAHVLDNPNDTDLVPTAWAVHGKVYGAQIRSGIGGTVVANPDFTAQTHGATSFADSAGRTWTVNGDLSISTRDIRFFGEVTNWPQKWDTTGTDVWVPIECAGILRRMSQGTAALHSALYRGIVNQTATVAYWPCEDLDGSTSVASALSPGRAMTLTGGTPEFGAETGFAASAPILQVNGTALHGIVLPYTATNFCQVQFLMHIPPGGTVNNAVICRINTGGTAAYWDLYYTTAAGGTLNLAAYDSDNVLLSTLSSAWSLNGDYLRMSVELTQSGANVSTKIASLVPGATTASTVTGTVNSRTVTRVTKVTMNPNRNMLDVAVGHVSAYKTLRDIFDLGDELAAWAGETAGRRIERLCDETGVPFEGIGNLDDSVRMGPQTPQQFRSLIQECVDADLGQLYEPRDSLALGYIPTSAIYTQPADLTLDYASFQLAELEPVEDDQLLRNDVTVTRSGGTSYRATLDDGTLSVQPPPDGVGPYDTSLTLNLFEDAQVADAAGWRVRLGTLDEARYPQIAVNLANAQFFNNTLLSTARAVDVGSRVAVSNPPAWLPPDAISALVQGYTEFLANFEHTISWNCSPSLPYDTAGRYSTTSTLPVEAGRARYSTDGSTLNGAHNSTTTSLSVATPSGPLWITTATVPGDFPFDIRVGGEKITVTAITGATSPQTFTVTRSVNGVVKAQTTGSAVELWAPTYYAL